MNRILAGLLALALWATPSFAQAPPSPPPVSVLAGQVALSVTNASARVALPSTAVSALAVTIYNKGSKDAYFKLGSSSVTAATTDTQIPAGTFITVWINGATNVASITGGADTTTLVIYQGTGPLQFGSLVAPQGAAPTGAAGGDLSGTYPNPSVASYNGGTVFGTAAAVNTGTSGTTVPLLNGANNFTGPTLGGTNGGGTGIMGIGTAPHSGYGLIIQPATANLLSGEILLLTSSANSNPTGTVAPATGLFGAVLNANWGGSIDNRANGIVNGTQNEAFVSDSASVLITYGSENAGVFSTSGTVVQGTGTYSHIDNQGTGTVTLAVGEDINIGNSGGGTITTSNGVHIFGLKGTTVHAIDINDQTFGSTNYAIYTRSGLVHFGDVVDAPQANIPILQGAVTVGLGGTSGAAAELIVNAPTSTGSNLLDLRVNGSNKFFVNNSGGFTIGADSQLGGNTLMTDSTQSIRLGGNILAANQNGVVGFSSTTHAYDTLDTGVSRVSAGLIGIGVNNSPGNTSGSLKFITYIASGSAPTLTGTCTTGSQAGGNTAGTFTATCAAQTVIITFATTAPTGWNCNAHDRTTPADALNQTASSTTSCTLTGTTVAADVISFDARAY